MYDQGLSLVLPQNGGNLRSKFQLLFLSGSFRIQETTRGEYKKKMRSWKFALFNLFCSSVFHGSVWLIGCSGIPFLFQGPQYNIDRLLNLKQFCMPMGRNSVWCTFAYFVGIPWRNHTNCSWVQLVCHSISHLPVVVASSYKSHQISDCKSLLFHRNTTTA